MELTKKNIHRVGQKEPVMSQVTLDDDVIVPDSKADMEAVILDCADVELEETRLMGSRLVVRGRLYFRVLYHTQKNRMVDSVEGTLPFEETINVSNIAEGDEVQVDWELEDLNVTMIHSRKLNIKALLTLAVMAQTQGVESVAIAAETSQGVETASRSVDVAQMAVQLRDTYRVKEEVELSGNKPNIAQILWYRLEPRGIECRPLDGKLSIHGEMELFCIYKGEEEHIPLQWVERSIPFSGALEVPESTDEMVPDIRIRPIHRDVEAKEDYDGEMRLLSVETVLEMDVRLYTEEHLAILDDVYCPGADVILQSRPIILDRLVTRNASKYKMTDKLTLSHADKVLQICHADGAVKLDHMEATEGGLDVEGTLCVDVLYVAADDQSPVRCVRGMLPFRYTVEVPGLRAGAVDGSSITGTSVFGGAATAMGQGRKSLLSRCRVIPGLEQLGAMMLGNGELEIKAVITLDSIVMEQLTVDGIDHVQIVPMDPQKFDRMPGIVGYVVQKGDTLWKIAKRFYASVDNIRDINGLSGDELMPGQKLLIIKQTERVL